MPHEDNNPKKSLAEDVAVPLVDVRPFANTFLFNFFFQPRKTGNCQDTPPINFQGAILRSSYIDIRGLNHWAAMPNLELFSNAGFPFTRFADLSQTRVVLPQQASAEEVSLYLDLLGYFGEQTGYPALRVEVGDVSALGGNVDYLIIGTPNDQPAFAQLDQRLHVSIKADGLSVKDTGGFFAAVQHAWWQVAEMRPDWWWKLDRSKTRNGLIASLGEFPDALIQGIESPWTSTRSVVTITLKNNDSADGFAEAFMKSEASGNISDSVSVLHGTTFTSYRLGDRFYHVGRLPLWSQIRYWLNEFPWLVVVLTFVLGLFVVPWTRAKLDRRSRDRLEVRQTS